MRPGGARTVYQQIGTHIGTATETVEVTTPFGIVAAIAIALAFVAALAWSPRLT